jgi:hypothetical protein
MESLLISNCLSQLCKLSYTLTQSVSTRVLYCDLVLHSGDQILNCFLLVTKLDQLKTENENCIRH